MFDLILQAIRSMLRKIEVVAKTPFWENVQNKPFEDKRYTGVLFNKTLFFNEAPSVTTVVDALPILGETYTVRWKGTEYQCIAKATNYGDSLAICLGNLEGLGEEKTEEPFLFAVDLAGQSDNPRHTIVLNYDYSAAEEVAVNIMGMLGEVKKIDELFLPEAAKTALYIKTDTNTATPTYDAGQYGLIEEAVRNGRTVYLLNERDIIEATFLNHSASNSDVFEFVGMAYGGRIVTYKLWDDGRIDKTEYTLTEA